MSGLINRTRSGIGIKRDECILPFSYAHMRAAASPYSNDIEVYGNRRSPDSGDIAVD
jgi:hypothetical protein